MNKISTPLFITAFFLCVSAPSFAATIQQEVTEKVNHILESEEGVKDVHVRVEMTPKIDPEVNAVNFMDFDLNKDGALDRDEVGEKLFYIFDRDGNHVVDNQEMNRIGVIPFAKMDKKTIEVVSYHDDAKQTRTSVSTDEFMQMSRLSKYDSAQDGLTPLDFIAMPFNRVDFNRDGLINMWEWKRAYAESVRPKHIESSIYNQ